MKLRNRIFLAGACALQLFALSATVHADQNLELFAYPNSTDNEAWGSGFDHQGNHYVDLFSIGNSIPTQWVTLRREASTTQYQIDDHYVLATGQSAFPYRMWVDLLGQVFVAGEAYDAAGSGHWIVRKRGLDGKWKTADDFQAAASQDAQAYIIASKGLEVYVAGQANVSSTEYGHLVVRKSSDGGDTWKTVLNYIPNQVGAAGADCVMISPTGTLIASGIAYPTAGNDFQWVTFRSTDAGGTWALVDSYTYLPTRMSAPQNCYADPDGKLYQSGASFRTATATDWGIGNMLLRSSSDDGKTWATEDEYIMPNGGSAIGHGLALYPNGDLFHVITTSIDPAGAYQQLLVRRQKVGQSTWENFVTYDGAYGNNGAGGKSIAISAAGEIIVTGYDYNSANPNSVASALVRQLQYQP